jgi:hypothetical protein
MGRCASIPSTQIINFTLVPPQFRFVFVSLVWSTCSASLWKYRTDLLITDAYLSIVNARLGRDNTEPVGYYKMNARSIYRFSRVIDMRLSVIVPTLSHQFSSLLVICNGKDIEAVTHVDHQRLALT